MKHSDGQETGSRSAPALNLLLTLALSLQSSVCFAAPVIARAKRSELGTQAMVNRQRFVDINISPDHVPFAFDYRGQPIQSLFKTWHRIPSELIDNADSRKTEFKYLEPGGPLQVRMLVTEYKRFAAVECALFIKNIGDVESPYLQDIRTSVVLKLGTTESPTLHHAAGNNEHVANPDGTPFMDFQPLSTVLQSGIPFTLGPAGGRSSDTVMPYFNLAWSADEGVIGAVGWAGHWRAGFLQDANLNFTSGLMDATRFTLKPNENEIRLPSVLLSFWSGDRIGGHNQFRRLLLKHYLPMPQDGSSLPVSAIAADCTGANDISEADQKSYIANIHANKLPFNTWWLDAGWFSVGRVTDWYYHAGNWFADSSNGRHFAGDLSSIASAANAVGMKFLLWFEPERAADATTMLVDPECSGCFLSNPSTPVAPQGRDGYDPQLDARYTHLLDLGNAKALDFAVSTFGQLIQQYGVDIFRHDFNMNPLPSWRLVDQTSGRYGLSEIKYVAGLYAFWERIQAGHPDLLIDSCASGGRRLDFETLRRTLPLYRSDNKLVPLGSTDPVPTDIRAQGMGFGLGYWLPVVGTTVGVPDTSRTQVNTYRSLLSATMSFVFGYSSSSSCVNGSGDGNWARARQVLEEYRRIQGIFLGDFYPLTDPTGFTPEAYASTDIWMAMQYDRPDLDQGIVLAFRRLTSTVAKTKFLLSGLKPSVTYLVTDMDSGVGTKHSGTYLMTSGLAVTIGTKQASALIQYSRLPSAVRAR